MQCICLLLLCCKNAVCAQGCQRAKSLLDGMDFFALPQTLVKFGRAEAVVLILMRYVDAAAAFGEQFFR